MIGTIHSKSSLSAAFDNRLSFGERSHAVGKGMQLAFIIDRVWCKLISVLLV